MTAPSPPLWLCGHLLALALVLAAGSSVTFAQLSRAAFRGAGSF